MFPKRFAPVRGDALSAARFGRRLEVYVPDSRVSRAHARLTRVGKPAIGALLLLVGVLGVTGGDQVIEARLLDLMPAWLVDVTTRL